MKNKQTTKDWKANMPAGPAPHINPKTSDAKTNAPIKAPKGGDFSNSK